MISTLIVGLSLLLPAQAPTTAPVAEPAPAPLAPPTPPRPGTYTYVWILDGEEVGETVFTVRPEKIERTEKTERTAKADKTVKQDGPGPTTSLVVDAHWRYSARGRQFSSTGVTKLNAKTLEAISFTGEQRVKTAGQWASSQKTDATVKNGVMTVRAERPKSIENFDVLVPEPAHFFANQAFEHLVLLGLVVHVSGDSRTFQLLDPRGGPKTLETTFTKEKREKGLTRWKVLAPGLEARLWLDATGVLTRYEQTVLQIVLRKSPTAKAAPPKEPAPKADPKARG